MPAGATSSPIQSTLSVYLSCPTSISFAEPSSSQTCGSGAYSAAYTGIGQTVGSTQDTVLYLASAAGGVKVNYTLVDVTTGKLLIKWLAYGLLAGGSCSAATAVLPADPSSGSTSYSINSGAVIASGDTLKLYLNTTFTPAPGTSGSPMYCSGGNSATLVSIGTTVVTGPQQPLLSTLLTPGTPYQTSLSGVPGVAETYMNTGSVNLNVLVLGVLKNSAGATVDIIPTSFPVASGQSVTAFLPFKQYPSGTYTVTVIAFTASNVPISTSAVAMVSV